MKTNTIATIVALGLLPITGFSQTPPTPPTPQTPSVAPVPPVPPLPLPSRGDRDRERLPKVPITYLGVETSSVPSVVAEQLGLAKGFGLVVDYVVPDGPAAAAGLQANDILKMLNDQILLEPDQLSKLIRSYSEGTSVTLTVLRKGAETKLTAKLGKREVSQRRGMPPGWKHGDGFGDLGPEFEREMREFSEEMGRNGEELGRQLREEMGDGKFGLVGDAVGSAREEIKRAREEARRSGEEGRRAAEEGRRAAAEGRRAADEARRVAEKGRGKTGNSVRVVTSNDNGVLKTTRIDLNKAQIIYSDAEGEMKIETVDNKKLLTAKDAQGRLLFSGPVETKEELDKLPAEVRQRYDKLEQKDIPAVVPAISKDDHDDDDAEDDAADDDDESDSTDVQEVSLKPIQSFPARHFGFNTVLI